MEEIYCPLCGQKKLDFLSKCSCGYNFEIEQPQSSEKLIKHDINFLKKNQLGITIFFVIIFINFLFNIQETSLLSSLFSALIDTLIALPIAVIVQFIYNIIKRKK